MKHSWITQTWMPPIEPAQCALCNRIIPPNKLYVRAAVAQDSRDAMGFDLCWGCYISDNKQKVKIYKP